MRNPATTVAVLESLRGVRIDRKTIHLPRWIGTEAARSVDGILKGAGGSWDADTIAFDNPVWPTLIFRFGPPSI